MKNRNEWKPNSYYDEFKEREGITRKIYIYIITILMTTDITK
jgi:hypothetical protein